MKTAERARGRWKEVLMHLGVDESFLRNRKGPSPICGGTDRFRWDDRGGNGSYYCEQCGAGSGLDLASRFTNLTIPEVSKKIDEFLGTDYVPAKIPERRDPRPALKRVSDASRPLTNQSCPVRRYLARRGLLPSRVTRISESQPYWDGEKRSGSYPAMIHLVVDPEGNPATFHVTYLTQDGQKAPVDCPRKLMTPSREWQGGAVRLCEASDEIGIAEGIETALAAQQIFGVPTWAAINAGNLERFIPPAGTQTVHVFGDNDASYTGQSSAYALARRLVTRNHIKAVVHIPGGVNTDWADHIGQEIKWNQ